MMKGICDVAYIRCSLKISYDISLFIHFFIYKKEVNNEKRRNKTIFKDGPKSLDFFGCWQCHPKFQPSLRSLNAWWWVSTSTYIPARSIDLSVQCIQTISCQLISFTDNDYTEHVSKFNVITYSCTIKVEFRCWS